ncbi:MAG: DUF1385 domain-containing protein [Clostridia bacterium]|nr:DUF1385 domain-containing protein [Clostridia bacterium]MBQ6931033.1 DUF1385 domain-containing protein [Clostridia bacterium]
MSEKEKIKYSGVGGEALIEGIMMKGPYGAAMACRMPDGSIDLTRKEFKSVTDKFKILKKPFIRGPVNFVEQMLFGYKCMMESAEKTAFDSNEMNEEEMSKLDKWLSDHFGPKMMAVIGVIAMVLGFGLAFLMFFYLPTLVTDLINDHLANGSLDRFRPLIEGVMRMIIFVAYMWGVSQMSDIKRVFKYHGAEHKSIFCVEHGLELTVENVRKQSRFHPRCGTSFIFITIILSIVVSSLVVVIAPEIRDIRWLWIIVKILLLPLIMSIGYECIRLAGKHDNFFTRALSAPGLMMQRITTKEPEDDIIEVGIAAIKAVIDPPEETEKAEENTDISDENNEAE